MKVKLITFLGSVAILLVALWSLWHAIKGSEVAVGFTRIGGANRVETAIEASRFWWRHPPKKFVLTAPREPKSVMWNAARCATLHDAPLLLMGQNERERRLVKRVSRQWGTRILVTPKHNPATCPDETKIDARQLPDLATPNNRCRGESSTPRFNCALLLPEYQPQAKLAHVVVFAAAKTWGDAPDIAVGFAVASHLAKAYRHVSFVVVPRYLEANAALEQKLRAEHELVTGGVVIGQNGAISEDTRALLRQIITETNRQDGLGQIKSSLGDFLVAVAALGALFGVATAARLAPELIQEGATQVSRLVRAAEGAVMQGTSLISGRRETDAAKAASGARELLDRVRGGEVTVVLRSGLRIKGTLEKRAAPSDKRDEPSENIVELLEATLAEDTAEVPPAKRVLFLARDIQAISTAMEPASR